jgi:hypothetical protein
MKKLALLFVAVFCMSGIANAISISIDVGDQPYYVHGSGYWVGRVHYCWVPGHWRGPFHRFWIHGHYVVC